jgi:hypothetical protein
MSSKLRKRPRLFVPLIALALIAALAVAGVPAVAQPIATTSRSLTKTVKRALGLAKSANRRSVAAIKLARSAGGRPGPRGTVGPQGPAGPQGAPGAPGSARAWAVVSSGGSLLKGSNIVSVKRVFTGAYCIEPGGGLGPANAAALATLDYSDGPVLTSDNVVIATEEANNGCPSPSTQFVVLTSDFEGTAKDDGFDFMVP